MNLPLESPYQRSPINETSQEEATIYGGWLSFKDNSWWIRDQEGACPIRFNSDQAPNPAQGFWALMIKKGSGWDLLSKKAIEGGQPFQGSTSLFNTQKHRFKVIERVRQFFYDAEFREVDTPARVICPSVEPYLDAFTAEEKYLRTSPELHMKRLLCSGWDRIFQIAPSFRNEPESKTHQQEFLMLEWYRTFCDLGSLVLDIQGLLRALAPFSSDPDYFKKPPILKSVPDLFLEGTGIDLTEPGSAFSMTELLKEKGFNVNQSDSWDDLFFMVFLNFLEPKLGEDQPVILMDYPASQSALAVVNPEKQGHYESCFRFELFIKGTECANAYNELTDPQEQMRRFEACNAERRTMGKPAHPNDELFMQAMNTGMPPSSGIALGLDRLIMLLAGEQDIRQTMIQYQDSTNF